MDPKLAQELAEFKKKKDDVFKNINLLNSLSETLVSSITDEETKIIQKKNKDFIENEKKKTASELELLGIENSKMESYLEILGKKQDLELKYLEQMCDQRARIHKMGEKYSYLDMNSFVPYDVHYQNQINDTKRVYANKDMPKSHTTPFVEEPASGTKRHQESHVPAVPPPPPRPDGISNSNGYTSQPHPNQPPIFQSNLPFPRVENNETGDQRHSSSPSGDISGDKHPPNPEPPPQSSQNSQRRTTVHSAEGISKRPPPERRMSLQDQLKEALTGKFRNAISGTDDAEGGSDNEEWK